MYLNVDANVTKLRLSQLTSFFQSQIFEMIEKANSSPSVYYNRITETFDFLSTIINFSILVIIVPFFEEFLFRGLALRAYEKARSTLFAAAFTSVLFFMYHGDFSRVTSLIIFSFIVVRAVQVFNSWWLAVIPHVTHNGFSFFLDYWAMVNQGTMQNEVKNPISLQIGLLELITAIITFCILMYWFEMQDKKSPIITQERKSEKIFTPSLTIFIFICSIFMWT